MLRRSDGVPLRLNLTLDRDIDIMHYLQPLLTRMEELSLGLSFSESVDSVPPVVIHDTHILRMLAMNGPYNNGNVASRPTPFSFQVLGPLKSISFEEYSYSFVSQYFHMSLI